MKTTQQLPENIDENEVVFIYVHGFGEFKEVVPFEEKMQKFLKKLPIKATVFTYRWDWLKIDVTKVVSQWTQAKIKADKAAKTFMDVILRKLEEKNIPYFIVGYSLGTRVVAESLRHGDTPLHFLRGIYFLGSALPHTYKLDEKLLPKEVKVMSYYSPYLDEVLKISFYNAEGIKAGGEVGFDEVGIVQNYRTVCSHVHKGGPLQRDYSNLASAIGYLSLGREGIYIKEGSSKFNFEIRVNSGALHWNDSIIFQRDSHTILIQQNVYTFHYRAVSIDPKGVRIRRAWGSNLHLILKELDLFRLY